MRGTKATRGSRITTAADADLDAVRRKAGAAGDSLAVALAAMDESDKVRSRFCRTRCEAQRRFLEALDHAAGDALYRRRFRVASHRDLVASIEVAPPLYANDSTGTRRVRVVLPKGRRLSASERVRLRAALLVVSDVVQGPPATGQETEVDVARRDGMPYIHAPLGLSGHGLALWREYLATYAALVRREARSQRPVVGRARRDRRASGRAPRGRRRGR